MVSIVYRCQHCDAQSSKWSGRCLECGKWGTLEKSVVEDASTPSQKRRAKLKETATATPILFSNIKSDSALRQPTNLSEVDRVLGGGLVGGALVLLAGEPGIGKSTLVAQIAGALDGVVLYISGEESAPQVKMRFDRLKIEQKNLQFLAEESIEVICKTIMELRPKLAIVDSVQTMASGSVEGEMGSVNQVKAVTVRLLEMAKASGVPILVIGHVTKGGEIGGPKTLEHMVDVVLQLEGDSQQFFRLLRGVKNRFGATNEVGVFTMEQNGLVAVADPSRLFIKERSQNSGSCLTAILEGSRVMIVEVQALVTKTSFGFPQRKSSGFDLGRLAMILAVLNRRTKIDLSSFDVHVNVAGGMKISEPAADLAVAFALASAYLNKPLVKTAVAFGEVGLGGEVRSVVREKERIKEAKRFGLTNVIASSNTKTISKALEIFTTVFLPHQNPR